MTQKSHFFSFSVIALLSHFLVCDWFKWNSVNSQQDVLRKLLIHFVFLTLGFTEMKHNSIFSELCLKFIHLSWIYCNVICQWRVSMLHFNGFLVCSGHNAMQFCAITFNIMKYTLFVTYYNILMFVYLHCYPWFIHYYCRNSPVKWC